MSLMTHTRTRGYCMCVCEMLTVGQCPLKMWHPEASRKGTHAISPTLRTQQQVFKKIPYGKGRSSYGQVQVMTPSPSSARTQVPNVSVTQVSHLLVSPRARGRKLPGQQGGFQMWGLQDLKVGL